MGSRYGFIPYVRVRAAIDHGDLGFLVKNARDLAHLSLSDALQVCLLYRDQNIDRYDAAAQRWLVRFVTEAKHVSTQHIQSAAAALELLREKPDEAMEQLASICVHYGLKK
jgi:hypothetical protein